METEECGRIPAGVVISLIFRLSNWLII